MLAAVSKAIISNVNDYQKQVELFSHISTLEQEYPHFKEWYYNTVLPETRAGLRKIIVASIENSIAGVLILKNCKEKKICTLRVAPDYRHNGLGHLFMDVAIHELETAYPLITVSDNHINEFEKLLNDYNFKLTGMYYEKYIDGHFELAFNGYL